MSEYADTNSPAQRLLRDQGQTKLESSLGSKIETFFTRMSEGRSVVERLTHCRETIFANTPSVLGDIPTQIRNVDVKAGKTSLPDAQALPLAFPGLVRTLDAAYQAALDTDASMKDVAAMRLASVVYSIGLILHPYRDGNGQTFRLTALSYIHELSPSRRSKFFPIKQDSGRGRIYGFIDNDVNNLPTFLDPIVNQITNLRLKLPTEDDITSYEGKIIPEMRQYAEQTLGESAKGLSDTQIVSALDNHAEKLNPASTIPLTENEESRKKLNLLLAYFFSPEGNADICNYITTGDIPLQENETDPLRKVTTTCFRRTQKQMESLLIERPQQSWLKRLFSRP